MKIDKGILTMGLALLLTLIVTRYVLRCVMRSIGTSNSNSAAARALEDKESVIGAGSYTDRKPKSLTAAPAPSKGNGKEGNIMIRKGMGKSSGGKRLIVHKGKGKGKFGKGLGDEAFVSPLSPLPEAELEDDFSSSDYDLVETSNTPSTYGAPSGSVSKSVSYSEERGSGQGGQSLSIADSPLAPQALSVASGGKSALPSARQVPNDTPMPHMLVRGSS